MKRPLVTSISLPEKEMAVWQSHHKEIRRFAERYLRVQMRKQMRREVTRRYNRQPGIKFLVRTVRFSAAEYDTFHYFASVLRVSVSSLVYGLILLWQKPARRAIRRFFESNYSASAEIWDTQAGLTEEGITFWYVDEKDENSPPPWEEALAHLQNTIQE